MNDWHCTTHNATWRSDQEECENPDPNTCRNLPQPAALDKLELLTWLIAQKQTAFKAIEGNTWTKDTYPDTDTRRAYLQGVEHGIDWAIQNACKLP